jgi:peptidoglycan hydrolase-like protein with peptidoglycan-binding domain
MIIKKYTEYHGLHYSVGLNESFTSENKIFEASENPVAVHYTLFTEAMNALDMLFSVAISANDKELTEIKSEYNAFLGDIKTSKDLNSIWDSLEKAASGIKSYIRVPKSPEVAGLKKEFDALKAKFEKGEISDKEFQAQKFDIQKKVVSNLSDVAESASLPIYQKIGENVINAISNFKKGAQLQIKKIEEAGKTASAISSIAGDINDKKASNIKDTKTKAEDKLEKDKEEWRGKDKDDKDKDDKDKSKIKDDSESKIAKKTNEGVGSILSGIGSALFGGDKTGTLGAVSKNTLIARASNIQAALMAMKREIDNVIAYDVNMGKMDQGSAGSAKDSASALISFYDRAYEYVAKINDVVGKKSGSELKSVGKQLNKIEDDLKEKIKPGGELEKWKDSVIGKAGINIADDAYLSKGKDLMGQAKKELETAVNRKYVEERIKEKEPSGLLTSLLGKKKKGDKGGSSRSKGKGKKSKTTNKKRTMKKYKTFPPNPTESDKEAIREYQKRLEVLGYLKKGSYKNGVYDEATKKATKLGMHCIAVLAVKKYTPSAEKDFRGYQLDLATYVDNRDKVVKYLAGDSAGSASSYEAPEELQGDDSKTEGKEGKPYPGKTFKKGSKGEDVKEIQQKLMDLGFLTGISKPTGNYLDKTVAAVKAFQKDKGIKPDGIVGANTWKMLMGEDSDKSDAKEDTEETIGSDSSTSSDKEDKSDSSEPSGSSDSGGDSDSGDDSDSDTKKSTDSKKSSTTKTLKRGSKGEAVRELQQKLIGLGYLNLSKPTVNYLDKTVAAVKSFQKDNGISPANGIANSETINAIEGAKPKTKTSSKKSGGKTSKVNQANTPAVVKSAKAKIKKGAKIAKTYAKKAANKANSVLSFAAKKPAAKKPAAKKPVAKKKK